MQSEPIGRTVIVQSPHRWIENIHVFMWLLKDTCWVLFWRPGGIFMIFPTLCVAFYILWRSRYSRSELFHNLAVCFWITANSVWMLSEFLHLDKEYKKYAIVFFVAGIATLVIYYLFFYRADRKKEKLPDNTMG
jgi:hypothetical protein